MLILSEKSFKCQWKWFYLSETELAVILNGKYRASLGKSEKFSNQTGQSSLAVACTRNQTHCDLKIT